MRIFFAILISILSVPLWSAVEAAEIIAIRASEQVDFHRLTLVFSEKVETDMSRKGDKLFVRMRDIRAGVMSNFPSTGYFKVNGLSRGSDPTGIFATLEMQVMEGSVVRHSMHSGPFRLMVDVYPPAAPEEKEDQEDKRRPTVEAQFLKPPPSRLVAFNDSWRWVYRNKAMEILKAELYSDPVSGAFRAVLGLNPGDGEFLDSAVKAASEHRKSGEHGKAGVLDAIIDFTRGKTAPPELDIALRSNPDPLYSRLGYFVLGDHFERKGFYPEAAGKLTRAAEGEDNPLKGEALFRKARILFFERKYAEAKELFMASLEAGYKGSGVWLANTALIKGEIESARTFYRETATSSVRLDTVSKLSLADMHLTMGDYAEARRIYGEISAGYPKDGFIGVFLSLKEGDTLLAEGRAKEALHIYIGAKGRFIGEEWAMAALSLADAYYISGETGSIEEAERLYQTIAAGGFAASEITSLKLLSARIRLGKFQEGYAFFKAFNGRYPLSIYRQDMDLLSSVLFYEWLDSLYQKGDHLAVVKLFLDVPLSAPFGKKAETYLKVGRSCMAAGLRNEAVNMLDNAVKLGSGQVAEEAMLALTRVYIEQKDTGSAERMLKAFRAKFPADGREAEIRELETLIAFEKGEYEKVSREKAGTGPGGILMKAESSYRAGRTDQSVPLFESAAKGFKTEGNEREASRSFLKSADALFEAGKFAKAAEGYRQAIGHMDAKETADRSWALYRMAQCYGRLGRDDDKAAALKELEALGGELAPWSDAIMKDPAAI
ncbi:MAG: tetratricopeptide repeat protein [Candidatus Methylomirabilis sp.]|nr:tetratricopeptide repeat protein [Deltaproteobacteria bacterium]